MNVLMAASEAVPFCKTGGLADVVGALSRILRRMGHRVVLFLPAYKAVEGGGFDLKPVPGRFLIPVGDDLISASLLRVDWEGVEVYFIRAQKYFSREGLYQDGDKDFPDNDERFIFFSRAVLEGAKFIGFKPEVVHCHDWQAALIPAYLRTLYRIDAHYVRAASVLTIHNLAYQGVFSKDSLFLTGFGWTDFTPERLEYYGGLNFLKAGLVFAEALTTVSPTYAREIQESPEFGRGLEGVLRRRSADLHGILNGLDTEVWDPQKDGALAVRYGAKDFPEGKRAGKAALQKELGLAARPEAPLIGIVSRLDPQKGLDVALKAAPGLMGGGAQLAVLGSGDAELARAFSEAASRQPSSFFFRQGFDEKTARRIYAAADLFLMPSRFEPCGLGQMIAMRYGAVPVVTSTGGLADTVRESAQGGLPGNGFVAGRCVLEEVSAALDRALKALARPADWAKIVRGAMAADLSWERSASRYVDLYRKAAAGVEAGP